MKSTCPHRAVPLLGDDHGHNDAEFNPGEMPRARWSRQGEILRCPWHGWEFDITTGKALSGEPWRVATYDVVMSEAKQETTVPTYQVIQSDNMLLLVLQK